MLGAGTIDCRRPLTTLKKSGYDSTITLEVFTPDRLYLKHSRDVLRRMWDETQSLNTFALLAVRPYLHLPP